MRNIFRISVILLSVLLVSVSCQRTVNDEAVNAYAFTAIAETVHEGNDIPVHLSFSDAGLTPDNAGWGDKWSKAIFYATLTDSYGHSVDNVVFSGPSGILSNGSVFDIPSSGRFDLIIAALREGKYELKLNIQTRYTVDTWASVSVDVLERNEVSPWGPDESGGVILVDDIIVPGADTGMDIDDIGNVVLDLKYFNVDNPFRFRCRVIPDNAANKQLLATSGDSGVSGAGIDGQTLLILTPVAVGQCSITVRSEDGHAEKSFGLTVIKSPDEATGFTLPTDDGERDDYDFDVAGRLELDIDKWNDGNPFEYICKPIPSSAQKPSLVAESDNESVVVAGIEDGNRLILTPKSPGYATVTVSTTNGSIVRTMRVVVFSAFSLVVDVVEDAAATDEETGIFPCELNFKTEAKWIPKMMQVEIYAKATGRIHLTDEADYFKVDTLRNARTAYFSYQEKVPVLYLVNGDSGYDIYSRLMKKVASMGTVVHHSADWPNNKDYILYFQLYRITLSLGMVDNYDSNIYRITIDERYNNPKNKLYQYLLY